MANGYTPMPHQASLQLSHLEAGDHHYESLSTHAGSEQRPCSTANDYEELVPLENARRSILQRPGDSMSSLHSETPIQGLAPVVDSAGAQENFPPSKNPNDVIQREKLNTRGSIHSWSLEMGALLLSIIAAIITVGLLRSQDGKALSTWSFPTSLNTLVSTIGTISRTSIAFAISACIGQQKWNWLRSGNDRLLAFQRFDEASRGPWGSLRLVIWLKARHWSTLGAMATLVFLAFDPFLQAIISYRGRLDVLAPSLHVVPSTIASAQYLDVGTLREGGTSTGTESTDTPYGQLYGMQFISRASFGFASALYRGFDNSSVDPDSQPRFNCPTGNCTWPTFASLAICSSCNDVTDHISVEKGHGQNGEATDRPLPYGNVAIESGNYTRFKLPYLQISEFDGMFSDNISEGALRPNTDPFLTANITTASQSTMTFQSHKTLLISYLVMLPSIDYWQKKASWEDTKPIATECALYFCVNAYNASSHMNNLTEGMVGSWAEKEDNSWLPTSNHSAAQWWEDQLDHTLYQPGFSMYLTDLQLKIPENQKSALSKEDAARRFNITQTSVFSTAGFLVDWSDSGTHKIANQSLSPNNYLVWSQDDSLPSLIDALWNSTDFDATFARVARSLTNYLRSTSNATQQGAVQQWVTHIKVDWAFMILPAISLLVGLVYVSLTILETHWLALPAWKEDAMATLAYGLDNETQKFLRDDAVAKRPWKMARQMQVRFPNDGGGLKVQ